MVPPLCLQSGRHPFSFALSLRVFATGCEVEMRSEENFTKAGIIQWQAVDAFYPA